MKKLITYKLIVIMLLSLSVISCNDFLDLAPDSSIGIENFFKTDNDFELALNGTYASYRSFFLVGPTAAHLQLTEARSDNFISDAGINDFIIDGASAFYSAHFNSAYRVIFQCNQILDRIDGIEFTDDDLKSKIKGQTYFIRAHVYFVLVRLYGGMPLVLNETTSFDGELIKIPRSTVAETYAQIESDLTMAKPLLPPTWSDSEKGRATSIAASMMLGKMYLQNGKKSEASTELQASKTLADANGYGLITSDYTDIFRSDNGNNKEIIHAIQCFGNNDFPYHFASGNSASVTGNINGTGAFIATDGLLACFEPDDKRKEACFFVDEIGTTFMYKFLSFTDINKSNADFPVLRYADLLLMLAEAEGESETSYEYINQVRNRAGISGISASTPETFTQKILQERRVEFFGEGERWYDLLRLMSPDDLVDYMNDFLLNQGGLSPSGNFVAIEPYKLLHALPNAVVISSEGVVAQNPGYTNPVGTSN